MMMDGYPPILVLQEAAVRIIRVGMNGLVPLEVAATSQTTSDHLYSVVVVVFCL